MLNIHRAACTNGCTHDFGYIVRFTAEGCWRDVRGRKGTGKSAVVGQTRENVGSRHKCSTVVAFEKDYTIFLTVFLKDVCE